MKTKTNSNDSQRTASVGGKGLVASAIALLAAVMWAYWPALQEIVAAWNSNPDYSHGFLVAPLAAVFLWVRRDRLDVDRVSPSWAGLALLLAVAGVRYVSGLYFLGPVDAWTLPLSIAGVVWLAFGGHCLRWAAPSVVFLFFMIPIPYSAETWLSVPLQRVATTLSTETLQLLGQPAVSEGNVIWIDDHPLMVAEACSGLRILVGVFALAFAYVLFSSWSWWQKCLVLAAAVPVALLANMLRIVCTGLLQRYISGEAAHRFSHDLAGFIMIPLAAALFWVFLMYVELLFPKVASVSPTSILASQGADGRVSNP